MSAIDLLAGLVLEDGRAWGEAAYPWQWTDARAFLEGSRRRCYFTRPRGGSKTSDAAGVMIADLLEDAPSLSRSYAVAVDRDQGRLLVDSIVGFVERTEGLAGALRLDKWIVTAPHGASLEILAADAPGAWGKRPRRLIVDEFARWPTTDEYRTLWTALHSALGKVPGSRLAILTSAGDPSHPAHKLLKRARESREWYVNEVDGPTPWIPEEDLAEDRAELSEWEYMRLHLNKWTAPSDRVARPEDLGACVTLLDWPLARDSRHSYAIGLDIGMVKDRAVAAVCHVEADGNARRLVLDQMQTWQGTQRNRVSLSAVEEWVLGASRSYGGARVHYDPYQAEQPAERLSRQGVRTERATFSAGENSKRALLLHQLIRSHTLAIPDDPELIDELANVRLIETSPGVYDSTTIPTGTTTGRSQSPSRGRRYSIISQAR